MTRRRDGLPTPGMKPSPRSPANRPRTWSACCARRPGWSSTSSPGDRVWHGVIAGISGDSVRFNLIAEVKAEPALPLTMLLSIFKFDRMEWAIEKATELGVERILPIVARRSEKHLAQSAQNRVERWRRIAREAAQQSRRSDVPVVEDVAQLKVAARREGKCGSAAARRTGADAHAVARRLWKRWLIPAISCRWFE